MDKAQEPLLVRSSAESSPAGGEVGFGWAEPGRFSVGVDPCVGGGWPLGFELGASGLGGLFDGGPVAGELVGGVVPLGVAGEFAGLVVEPAEEGLAHAS